MENKKGSKAKYGAIVIILLLMIGPYAVFMLQPSEDSSGQTVINNDIVMDNNITIPILTNNLSVICVTGYSSTVRDVSQKLREEIFARDNVTYALELPTGSTELDHRINLAIGGNNEASNLMVQFEAYPGYHEKDKLENYLLKNVCNGNIDINYAQERIYNDWYGYYKEVYENGV